MAGKTLRQALKTVEMELSMSETRRGGAEQDARLARQEVEGVQQARDWYQAQMKESQGSQSSVVRDAALLREEAALVRSRNEQLANQVQGLQQQLLLQRDDLLKEKQLMVAKLEMLEDPSDEESVESRSTPQFSVEDERILRMEEKLQETESALVADKEAMEEMVRLKKELEDQSHYLKESLINEQGYTKTVLLDLNESKEEVQRLTDEIQRRTDAAKSKDVQIIKMNLEIQSLGQGKTQLEDQFGRKISELEKSSCNCQKLKQQIKENYSEKEKLVLEIEQMKDIAKEFANSQEILQGLRNENIEIKRVNLKIEPLLQENAHLVDKLKSLQLDADLNRDKTEQLDILRRENESLQESMQSLLHQMTILTTKCEENSSIGSEAEKLMLALGLENVKLIDQVSEAEKQIETHLEMKSKENEMLQIMQTENNELKTKLDMHEKQFSDEKVDLERVIQQLENVQDKLLNDKSHGVSFREELFEDLQNSDRENKEKIKILDSSLKHYEIRLNEQTSIKEACLREMDELREVEREQQNLIRMQKDKMRRLDAEITGLKEENKRKEESLNTCRVDLLQLEKEKGMLSAVSYENRALKENCSLLEKSLEKFNDCQGKVSILEHSLFKSQETMHDKEEKIGDLQKENTELRKKVKDMSTDLSSERQEGQRLKISLEAANKLIERARKKEIGEREELETLNLNIKKLHDEKLLLERRHQGSMDMAAELKIQLESKHHMENVLEDRMKSLNLHLQDKNQTINLLKQEAGHKEELHKAEIAQMAFKSEKIQKNFSARESLLHSLGEEQALHRRQLRQLQVALRSSLGHIRGLKALISDSSSPPLQPPVDEASLSQLLQLTPHRPKLAGLKLCLAELRRDVKELNLQLDRSRGATPTLSLRTETPSFLERFQAGSSCSSGSATPSLQLSPGSSAHTSPQHLSRR